MTETGTKTKYIFFYFKSQYHRCDDTAWVKLTHRERKSVFLMQILKGLAGSSTPSIRKQSVDGGCGAERCELKNEHKRL